MEYDRGTGRDASTAASHPHKGQQKGRKSKGGEVGGGRGGGAGGGSGGRRGHSRRSEGRSSGFDPHASIAPKILTKRAVAPADPADLSQPSPPPSSILSSPTSLSIPPTERTLFIPSTSSSSTSSPTSTSASPHHHKLTDNSPTSLRPTPPSSTLPRTSSPALPNPTLATPTPPLPPPPQPLTSPSAPIKLLTPHFRLSSLDLLTPLLFDHPHFTVISNLGMHGVGKSSLINTLLPRPSPSPFHVGAGGGGGGGGQVHTTQGMDLIATPDHVLYLDTQPLLSPSVVAALQREEVGGAGGGGGGGGGGGPGHSFNSAFTAQVTADMFDLQLPLLLLSISHILLLAVTWPIPLPLLSHLRTVFTLHSQLSPTLPPSPHPPCHVILLLNKAAENSDDSPLSTHSPLSLQLAVDALLAECGVGGGGVVVGGGGGVRKGVSGAGGGRGEEPVGGEGGEAGHHVRVCVVPWKERGSLYESSLREMRQVVLGLRREGAGGGGGTGGANNGGGGEKEWGKRVTAVHSALVHSSVMREQRKAIERRVALVHPPPPSPSPMASMSTAGHHGGGHGGAHAGHGQGRRGGLGAHAAVKEAGDASYHRDAPATSHHKLYTPP